MLFVLAIPAVAHISATSPGFAGTTQEIVLGVGHGCEAFDTTSIKTTLPAGLSGVRVLNSEFGRATVETNATGQPTAVTWTKDDADINPGDTHYYKLGIRARLPNAPFTTLYFPTVQTCKLPDGGTLTSLWTNTSGVPPDAGEPEEAPATRLLPARRAGWNKYTVPVAIENLLVFFSDAQIVWRGNQAFSPNPAITELISGTAGVNALTSLQANDEIWVKY